MYCTFQLQLLQAALVSNGQKSPFCGGSLVRKVGRHGFVPTFLTSCFVKTIDKYGIIPRCEKWIFFVIELHLVLTCFDLSALYCTCQQLPRVIVGSIINKDAPAPPPLFLSRLSNIYCIVKTFNQEVYRLFNSKSLSNQT